MAASEPAVLLLVVGALLLAGAILFFGVFAKPDLPIERKTFLTAAELRFLGILERALPGHHISCQVSMGALLKPRKGLGKKRFWAVRGRFGQKIVDYVVIDPRTGMVQAVIELDDSSHDAAKDAARDAMMAKGGYRTIRFPSRPQPTEAIVREKTADLGLA